MSEFTGKRITVAGLGHFGGGIAVTRWLVGQGARVLVTDTEKPEKLAESCEHLKDLPLQFRLGEHRTEDFTSADLVVASPAIPPSNEYLAAARAASVPVTTEIRLFIERCPARILGVTGTKGKSTTASMLHAILGSRFKAWLGGNIGRSLLQDLPSIRPDHLVVLELSSFMLEYLGEMRWSPHIALATMLAADHLNRHGTMDAYLDAKANIVRFQKPGDFAVLNADCPLARRFADVAGGRVAWFRPDPARSLALTVPGEHNQLNAQAAFAAAACLGVTRDEAQRALSGYAALPHRLQLVHEEKGVRYYNDSIATIAEAAAAALGAFPSRTVLQIVGGADKKLPMHLLYKAMAERARVVLCIGQLGPKMAEEVRKASAGSGLMVLECGTMDCAVEAARALARPGDVVLMSPGCASYGQFSNFEQRGETFARLARRGPGATL